MKTAFRPIVNDQCKVLILGTMPGERSLKLNQYYAHKRNQFWKIMFVIFKEQFSEDYERRQKLLLSNGVALWDVLIHCERETSADHKITKEEVNDFDLFYKTYPNIKHVFFSSGKAKSLYEASVSSPSYLSFGLLPSPSSANTWKSLDEKVSDWKIIIDVLAK